MPILKSAKKKLRQDKKRTKHNLKTKKTYKDALKNVSRAKPQGRVKLLSEAYSAIDKAAKRGVIHKKKAARLKRRVAKLKT